MASIYPKIKEGKISSFKFKVFLGRDNTGKQIFKCTTWTPEKRMSESKLKQQAEKEAAIWERKVIDEWRDQKLEHTPKDILFKDFVEEMWFPAQMNEKEHRASTIAFHSYLLKVITPYFEKMKMCDITSRHIEQYLDYLRFTYKTKNAASPSPKTVRHHYSTLNLIFEYALKLSYISDNPLDKVKTPKLTKHAVDALSKDEVFMFIKEVNKLPLEKRLIYYLLLTTGVRRGECFGLQWGDIDFESRLLHIKRNVTYTTHGGVSVGLPKTNAGIRKIPLTDSVVDLLIEYKTSEELSFALSNDMFLFHATKSPYQPHDPTYITKHMKRFMKRIGLPDMSPHDLRHTCASLLLQDGADIKSVQDILGHTNASTTLDFYVKSSVETMRAATNTTFNFNV